MKILVTGSDGLVGSALRAVCHNYPQHQFVFLNRKNCDLTYDKDVNWMYFNHKPDAVIHCAALVGGIKMNNEQPADLFTQNIIMNSLVIDGAHRAGVQKLIVFSSACAFPDKYPMVEDMLQDGAPFPNNLSYGYAKRMVDIQTRAYREQHHRSYVSLIPVSLYGHHDNFSIDNGHFIPALIHKCYHARKKNEPLTVWGDGSSMRELLYSEDLAKIVMELIEGCPHEKYIVSSGEEISVRNVAVKVAEMMGVKSVHFDATKPNGQHRKPTDTSRLKGVLGDFPYTPFEEGLKQTVAWFESNYPNLRR